MLIKEIILKKYKDVRLNTIERNLQGEEAIAYLEYVSRELGDVILIERLKIAGYFVTDRNKIGFNKKNKTHSPATDKKQRTFNNNNYEDIC